MLHYVEKVVHLNGKVSLHGCVPVKQADDLATNTLPFCIESQVSKQERKLEKMRTAEAMRYQQSMALPREQKAIEQLPRRVQAKLEGKGGVSP